MKKVILGFGALFFLSSCIVSTATKVVSTSVKAATGVVSGTVKGIGWAVKKAEGKINEDLLDGRWQLVGVYSGSYDALPQDPVNLLNTGCAKEITEFKSRKEKYRPVFCDGSKMDWQKYDFSFGKNPSTRERENYLELNKNNYVTIINVDSQNLILQGNFSPTYSLQGGTIYLLKKIK